MNTLNPMLNLSILLFIASGGFFLVGFNLGGYAMIVFSFLSILCYLYYVRHLNKDKLK